MRKIIVIGFASLMLTLLTAPVQAGAIWLNTTGDNMWNTDGNWSAPPSGATCIFNSSSPAGNVYLNADFSIARVRQNVSAPARIVSIASTNLNDATLTITGSSETFDGAAATANFTFDGTPNGNGAGMKLAIATTLPIVVNTGRIFDFNLDISGAGGVNKSGNGTLILGGVNTYTSPTTVSQGKLLVNGSIAAVSTVTVSGGTLGGNGTINGTATIQSATLAPGASAGTLTFASDLTLESGSVLSYELLGTDQTVGGGINDLTVVGGNLILDGTLNIIELVADSFQTASVGDKWRLFNYSGTLTDNGLLLGAMPPNLTFGIDTATAGQVDLVITAVPEPSAMGLGLLGGLGLLAVFQRRRSA